MATRDSTTDEVNYLNTDRPSSLRDLIEVNASVQGAPSAGNTDSSASAV